MNYLGIDYYVKNMPALDPGFIPFGVWAKACLLYTSHLYHHIHELDCIQFLMGPATEVTMTGGNVAHKGEQFGDEDDMLFLLLEFGNGTYAVVEYGLSLIHI